MAPIKFEEHIKEKLEGRRIEPTAAGWERISGQLEIQQGKKRTKRVLWMSIAASFVIGVSLATLFFQKDSSAVGPIVDTTKKTSTQELLENVNKQERIPVISNQIQEQQVAEVVILERSAPKEIKATKKKRQTQKPKTENYKRQPGHTPFQETIAVQGNTKQTDGIPATTVNPIKPPIVNKLEDVIAFKVEEVVAAVEHKELVTDQEIEALLLQAQREIVSKQLLKEANVAIDANALLLDAEYAVDPDTFKDKVFRSVKKEFNRAIEAVANKDN